MESTVPLSFVIWLAGFTVTLLGGCWAIFKYFEFQIKADKKDTSEQLKRMYERMDDNKKSYYNDFVLKEVLRESMDARKLITDEKFDGLIKLFNEKIESLRTEIRNYYNNKNGGQHG